jgi:hypothetical protein
MRASRVAFNLALLSLDDSLISSYIYCKKYFIKCCNDPFFIPRIKKSTEGKIESILQNEDITSETKMVLISALYFKAEWSKPFDPEHTRSGVNFANVLRTAFTLVDPESVKKIQLSHLYLFTLAGSASV